MTEQNVLEQLDRDLSRVEAAEACRNLMGKYCYYQASFRTKEYVDLWAKRDDDLLILPWKTYNGYEAVKDFYMNEFGDRSDPETYNKIHGAMLLHEMDTEILEVAEDCRTAKGAWISQGNETHVDSPDKGNGRDNAHAKWCYGKYGVDFILDSDGRWKIWHMRLYPVFKCNYGESWVDSSYAPDDPHAGEATSWGYTPGGLYPANEPPIPYPYEKFEDVGITITEEE